MDLEKQPKKDEGNLFPASFTSIIDEFKKTVTQTLWMSTILITTSILSFLGPSKHPFKLCKQKKVHFKDLPEMPEQYHDTDQRCPDTSEVDDKGGKREDTTEQRQEFTKKVNTLKCLQRRSRRLRGLRPERLR